MRLNLSRPVVFMDLETTGVDISRDRIVEISAVKVFPDGHHEVRTRRINPEMHIPEAASAVHGIYDSDVRDEPAFSRIARGLASFLDDCDMAGFNSNRFDIPLLAEEFARAGVDIDLHDRRFIDVQTIYHRLEPRTLSAAYQFYCGSSLDDAHSAEADTMATYEVLMAQLDRYGDLKNDVEFLSEYSTQTRTADFAGRVAYDQDGKEIFNFGKYKGRPVAEVFAESPGYYRWIMEGDFPRDTKMVVDRIWRRHV